MHNNKTPQGEDEFKKELSPEEYKIMREKGTEAPFSGVYTYETKDGIYFCKACGNPLFSSSTKFDSGTGWPSFDEALSGAVISRPDISDGSERTEIVCAKCGSHLGHLFNDGPTETGKRYCMNSLCLDLVEND